MPKGRRKKTPKKPAEKTPRQLIRQTKRQQIPAKLSAKIPDEVYRQVEQAERETPKGRTPLVVVHDPATPMADALVVMRLSSFQGHPQVNSVQPTSRGEESSDG